MLSCRLKIAFIRLFSHRRCGCEREARKKWLCKKEQFLEQHSNHLKPILDFIQPWLHCHAGWGRPLVTLLSKASFWGPFLCYFPWTWEDPQVSCWNVLHISDSILAQQMLSTQVLSSLTLFMPFSHSFPIFFPRCCHLFSQKATFLSLTPRFASILGMASSTWSLVFNICSFPTPPGTSAENMEGKCCLRETITHQTIRLRFMLGGFHQDMLDEYIYMYIYNIYIYVYIYNIYVYI